MERQTRHQRVINNDFYDELGEAWYQASDHPVALLRAENRVRIPWIQEEIEKRFSKKISLLDIGCGAGFLTNALAQEGHEITGIDLSEESLAIARRHDATQRVHYLAADGCSLPFPDSSFEVVSALDVLEHVENPSLLIGEAARVLKEGGLFFFHTFNRNFWSYLLVIKGVEWCVCNAPKEMHLYSLFIKPQEIKDFCLEVGLEVTALLGLKPRLFRRSFFELLFTRKVPRNFSFHFCKSLATGYCGIAEKRDF